MKMLSISLVWNILLLLLISYSQKANTNEELMILHDEDFYDMCDSSTTINAAAESCDYKVWHANQKLLFTSKEGFDFSKELLIIQGDSHQNCLNKCLDEVSCTAVMTNSSDFGKCYLFQERYFVSEPAGDADIVTYILKCCQPKPMKIGGAAKLKNLLAVYSPETYCTKKSLSFKKSKCNYKIWNVSNGRKFAAADVQPQKMKSIKISDCLKKCLENGKCSLVTIDGNNENTCYIHEGAVSKNESLLDTDGWLSYTRICCNLKLRKRVTLRKQFFSQEGYIWILIGGMIGMIIIVSVAVLAFWMVKKKSQQQEQAENESFLGEKFYLFDKETKYEIEDEDSLNDIDWELH